MTSLGLANHEIADRLRLSVHAVKFHLASIYRKLGVANRTEAVVEFMRSGQREGSREPAAETTSGSTESTTTE